MIINVKVITNASKTEVVKRDELFLVKVHSSPEKGKANKEVIKLLSKYFDCSKSCIEIVKGAKNNLKIIEVSK